MELRGSRVLLLGGSGLVGMAIARQVLEHRPQAVVVSGLTRVEVEEGLAELRPHAEAMGVEVNGEWGDIFVAHELKDRARPELLDDPAGRDRLLQDLYAESPADSVERSTLGRILLDHRPTIVVDCVNTATVFAYQNVFASAARVLDEVRAGAVSIETVERHLATLYLPQLIRHVQLALEAMRRTGTELYLKIGTSGTGGMGMNIPFTHSEERPSRVLLAKASLAGAHTLLLFLMARTPGAPAVKEIKPTAAVAWKRIAFGEVRRRGRVVPRLDATAPMRVEDAIANTPEAAAAWRETGQPLRGVFLDAGENGLFSLPEFETLTALGLMEYITPEEIARDVVWEILGHSTGHDVVAALDAATSGPTYRGGVLRHFAMERMEELETEHAVESVAYEMLGPPRLSKLLFEAAILGRLFEHRLEGAAALEPEATAARSAELIERDEDLRTRILSIGLPILLPDGERMLRGAEIKVAPEIGEDASPDRLVERGWVDLRPGNWGRWRDRVRHMRASLAGFGGPDADSSYDLESWQITGRFRPGSLVAWVFRHEDGGERIKR